METNVYKAQLETDLETLTTDLEAVATLNKKTGDWVAVPESDTLGNADDNVEADVTEDWNERRSLMTSLETRYKNIKRALEKISAGTYGVCEICNNAIEADRLHANPAARTCKSDLEKESELSL